MPVAGRKPKPDGQKRNRHKPTHEWTEVVDVPYAGKPPALSREVGWPPATKRWWRSVSRMPHCALWAETDWQFAQDTAVLHKAFAEGDLRIATELRQREKVLGTTADARRDLRIRYVQPEEESDVDSGNVTSLAKYRAVLDDGGD